MMPRPRPFSYMMPRPRPIGTMFVRRNSCINFSPNAQKICINSRQVPNAQVSYCTPLDYLRIAIPHTSQVSAPNKIRYMDLWLTDPIYSVMV
jgi:hypothetical protein